MKITFIPDAADFVWLTFDPQAPGREHAEPLGRCTNEVMEEVRARLAPLLGY